jgi:hypothetical protein
MINHRYNRIATRRPALGRFYPPILLSSAVIFHEDLECFLDPVQTR